MLGCCASCKYSLDIFLLTGFDKAMCIFTTVNRVLLFLFFFAWCQSLPAVSRCVRCRLWMETQRYSSSVCGQAALRRRRCPFPGLSVNASGYGNYSTTINDIQSLNRREIICKAEHPLIQTHCSVIPRKPCSVSYWNVKYWYLSYKLIPFAK